MKLIWALNDNQVPTNDENIAIHTACGTHDAQMLSPQYNITELDAIIADPNTSIYDLGVHNISVPSNIDTYYYCVVVQLPVNHSIQQIVAVCK